jgi:hypothetical protein
LGGPIAEAAPVATAAVDVLKELKNELPGFVAILFYALE